MGVLSACPQSPPWAPQLGAVREAGSQVRGGNLGVERVGGRTFSSDSEEQWSLRAIPRDLFSPLDSGVQVSHPGPTSWGTTCAGAQAQCPEGPALALRLCPRGPETLSFYTGPTFPFCTGRTHYAVGPGSHTQRRKTQT